MTGRGDYVLSTDRQKFANTGLREAHHSTDHQMVLDMLRGEGALHNFRYRQGRTRWPLHLKSVHPQKEGGVEFTELKGDIDRTLRPKKAQVSWIYQETCWLLDRRTMLQWAAMASVREVRQARKDFQKSLQEERQQRFQEAGVDIEAIVAVDQMQEVCTAFRGGTDMRQ